MGLLTDSLLRNEDRYLLLRLFTISELLAKSLNYDSPTDLENCGLTTRSNTNSQTNWENCGFTIFFSEFRVAPWGVISVACLNLPINVLIN